MHHNHSLRCSSASGWHLLFDSTPAFSPELSAADSETCVLTVIFFNLNFLYLHHFAADKIFFHLQECDTISIRILWIVVLRRPLRYFKIVFSFHPSVPLIVTSLVLHWLSLKCGSEHCCISVGVCRHCPLHCQWDSQSNRRVLYRVLSSVMGQRVTWLSSWRCTGWSVGLLPSLLRTQFPRCFQSSSSSLPGAVQN